MIKQFGTIYGNVENNVQYLATLIPLDSIAGSIESTASLIGTVNVPAVLNEPYLGVCEVSPSYETQYLRTKHKIMPDDITINAIPLSYMDTADATATSVLIADGYTAYVQGEKVVGTAAIIYDPVGKELTLPDWTVVING